MKITEKRILESGKLQSICIQSGWYDRGTNEDYAKLFDMVVGHNMTPNRIYKVAMDIIRHTDGYHETYVNDVMMDITRGCYSVYDIE